MHLIFPICEMELINGKTFRRLVRGLSKSTQFLNVTGTL